MVGPTPAEPSSAAIHAAICVLGCPVGGAALVRRAEAAAITYRDRSATVAVACGGRSWRGQVEADELARVMALGGVPAAAIVRERCSLDTRDNARFAAALLRRRGLSKVVLVTCTWHLPRATALFEAAGLEVEGVGVEPPSSTVLQRFYWRHRERVSAWKDALRTTRIV